MGTNVTEFRSTSALEAGHVMWQVFPPLVMSVGTVANVLSIVVLSRPSMNRSSYTVYLLALAIADITMLYTGLLRQWVKHVFDVDVRYTSNVACKIHMWLVYTNADICAWILTVITLERLVSTIFPTKTTFWCTKQNAKIVLFILIIVMMLVNSHLLYGFGRREIERGNVTVVEPCYPITDAYADFFELVWSWMDLCIASLIPFTILTLGNVWIIRALINSSRRVQTTMTTSRSNMSRLLLSLNVVFIVCTAPICVYQIGDGYWVPRGLPRHVKERDPVWASVNLLLYVNNAINFFMYCLSGSKFRAELRKLYQSSANKTRRFSLAQTISRHMSTSSEII